MSNTPRQKAWDVYEERQGGEWKRVTTVFYDRDCSAIYVRDGLIHHDGYNPEIMVRCEETLEEWGPGDREA